MCQCINSACLRLCIDSRPIKSACIFVYASALVCVCACVAQEDMHWTWSGPPSSSSEESGELQDSSVSCSPPSRCVCVDVCSTVNGGKTQIERFFFRHFSSGSTYPLRPPVPHVPHQEPQQLGVILITVAHAVLVALPLVFLHDLKKRKKEKNK